jgi:hypothetical protein
MHETYEHPEGSECCQKTAADSGTPRGKLNRWYRQGCVEGKTIDDARSAAKCEVNVVPVTEGRREQKAQTDYGKRCSYLEVVITTANGERLLIVVGIRDREWQSK